MTLDDCQWRPGGLAHLELTGGCASIWPQEHIDVVCLIVLATSGAIVTEVIDYEAWLGVRAIPCVAVVVSLAVGFMGIPGGLGPTSTAVLRV